MRDFNLDFDIEMAQRDTTEKEDLQSDMISDCVRIISNLENYHLDLYTEEVQELAKQLSTIAKRVDDNLETD